MKNYKYFLFTLFALTAFCMNAQVTDDTNVPNVNHWVGYDNNSGIVLPILNIGDPRINLSSNNNTKMYFREQPTWYGLNGITRTDVQRTLMSLQGQSDTLAWSILHLYDDADGHVPSTMRRDWFNLGISYSSNFDFMYTGMLERPTADGEDLDTDAVIAWGCQDGSQSQIDNFRFLFIQPTNMFPSSSATSEQGRETMRITPFGNVGIGDFSHMPTGLDEQPTQKLDVDGTARLRQMPNDTMDVIITGVYAEEPNVDGDFILN